MSVKKSNGAAPREGTASEVREAIRSGVSESATSPERPQRRAFTAEYKLRIVRTACSGYGRGCDAWSKDEKVVSCSDIDDQMKKAARCIEAVEKLDSDCLPRLSQRREAQFREGKKAYDFCKEVLDYKKDKKLCR